MNVPCISKVPIQTTTVEYNDQYGTYVGEASSANLSSSSASIVKDSHVLEHTTSIQQCNGKECFSEPFFPPGFESVVSNNNLRGLETLMFPEIVMGNNNTKSVNWIKNTLIPTVVTLGVTSHRGMKFVESMANKVGDRSIREMIVPNDDDIEKQNYKDSNLVLGECLGSYGD
ncbi:hypothetical protein FRX31_027104 [Thalictrum thalictroides]|uniref:Uncharacterized protein n=1 Tax=Thalictrum thalictroides TaxID=46969 RepID=A0A7J6VGJ2_THATH|nr:hypothetical protein FRX31_027104 [Thalictrum thalictroides]